MANTIKRDATREEKKILEYPIGLSSLSTKDSKKLPSFMMFRINTPTSAATLRDDVKVAPLLIANTQQGTGIETNPGNFTDASKNTLKNQARQQAQFRYSNEDVDKEKWLVKKNMSRLDRVIVLPMPNDHRVQTAVSYNTNYDPGGLTKFTDAINQMGNGSITEALTIAANKYAAGSINSLKQSAVGGNTNITSGNQLLAEERKAENPKKEVMYKGIDFRSYTFQFLFAPKSADESKSVQRIIETFRYYSLPELAPGKQYFTFPGEFEISFYYGAQDNPNIPKIAPSVLQRVNVDYSPGGTGWALLPDGSPVQLSMTLEFVELEMIDRTRVYNKDSRITSGY